MIFLAKPPNPKILVNSFITSGITRPMPLSNNWAMAPPAPVAKAIMDFVISGSIVKVA